MVKIKEVTKEEEDFIKENLLYDFETGYLWWNKHGFGRQFDKPAGCLNKVGYIQVRVKSVAYAAHRVAWFLFYGMWPKDQIDHINNVRDDNRIVNLREATSTENHGNMKVRKGGTSKYKGVCWHKQLCKWNVRIMLNYKQIHLGCYDNEEEAALAYNKAALEYFGEYAKINDVTP